jgi:hypothetical protein
VDRDVTPEAIAVAIDEATRAQEGIMGLRIRR